MLAVVIIRCFNRNRRNELTRNGVNKRRDEAIKYYEVLGGKNIKYPLDFRKMQNGASNLGK